MSGEIIPIKPIAGTPALAAAFGYQESDLTDGANLGFPVISYRGKVWRLVHKGNQTKLMTPDGDPIPSIRVVILKANSALSKIYYEKSYTEGDADAPDCFSMDGVAPDSNARNPQAKQCEVCPKAQWGSRVSDEGKELKACQDSRRLVVVPANDIANDAMGGPMLLRVPAASLANLVAYDDRLKKAGAAYFGVATKISFDSDVAYPKLTFDYDGESTQSLTEADAQKILELRESEAVSRILMTRSTHENGDAEAPKRPAKEAPKPAVTEVQEPPPEPAPSETTAESDTSTEEAAPAKETVVTEKSVDDLVSGLLS